ncbi:hypothetical protein Q5P01_024753 [Channa striata]|uniref:PH and SEC7 domain-containing protein 4-like n=1 Tax=Channa striata TaxID=64152 RepID=A0AA88LN69_CHASR|nr:hypothetical protein Q5P01_024753 [Channa striata]
MEEENLCSSLADNSDLVLQQPQQDSWTPVNQQYINGEQESIVLGEPKMQINQPHGTDQLPLFTQEVGVSPAEGEQWEQVILPVPSMPCTSALSFATVQWDLRVEETSSPLTDSSLANELEFCGVTSLSLNPTSLSLHQCADGNTEFFIQTDREEQDGSDTQFLNSDLDVTENGPEPCDATDVQDLTTQEKEDSTFELLNCKNEVPLSTVSEEEGNSVTSEPVKTLDLTNSLEEGEDSDDEAHSFVYLKLEEEQEEPCILLTEEGNSEKEQTSANGVENEDWSKEGHEVEEEQSVTKGLYAVESYLSDEDVSGEPLQIDNAGLNISPDNLIYLLPSELPEESLHSGSEPDTEILEQLDENPTGQSDNPEMCTDVDQNMHPEQSETVDDNEETSTQAAEVTERIEHSQEILEMTNCLEKQDCDQTTFQDRELSPQPGHAVSEQLEIFKDSEQIQAEVSYQTEEQYSNEDPELFVLSQNQDQLPERELTEQSVHPETTETVDKSEEGGVCFEAEQPEDPEMETLTEQNERPLQAADVPTLSEQLVQPEKTVEPEVTQQTEEVELTKVDERVETSEQAEDVGEDGDVQTVVAKAEEASPSETAVLHMNGGEVDRQMACRLAERLFKLDGIQRVDVVKHMDKDNNFSRAVGEEYLKFFDFTGHSLDHALRSFLKVVILIGETQERERVLQHFTCRFHQCNPDSFSSSGAVLALTCALMLLNTDLHGQNVGKSMSSSKFVSNLDGMNDGENFSKDLLKSFYNSIKSEPLEWAVGEAELKSCVLMEEDTRDFATLRSKANPFLDVPHDKTASVVKEGFLQRKLHADIDGKRTPWGKRGWKTFYGVLRGMVLYLQKDDYRNQPTNEEVVSVHHSLAEQAADYTKKPHVFRLQTADWRVFLFQASSKVEMNSWINRINLVSALHSSPPFPAAVGSQRKFFRPILPASQSAHTLERQLQSHAGMLESFKADLSYLQHNAPEGKKAKAKELEEHRVRAEYLQHEMNRYEIYIQMLEGWKKVAKTDDVVFSPGEMNQFDKAICADYLEEEEEEGSLKKSHSSPSLELELAPPTVIKVKRNISERRTYRKAVIPRRNKEA